MGAILGHPPALASLIPPKTTWGPTCAKALANYSFILWPEFQRGDYPPSLVIKTLRTSETIGKVQGAKFCVLFR